MFPNEVEEFLSIVSKEASSLGKEPQLSKLKSWVQVKGRKRKDLFKFFVYAFGHFNFNTNAG